MMCLVVAMGNQATLVARCGGSLTPAPHHVRLAHVELPATSTSHAKAARLSLRNLCLNKAAEISPLGRDGDGFTLAHVHCADKDVEEHLLAEGLAHMKKMAPFDAMELKVFQDAAQHAQLGLWSLGSAHRHH